MDKVFLIEGMSCEHCVSHIEKAINSIDGVMGTVDLISNSVTVTLANPNILDLVKAAIEEAGYDVVGEK